ncbi:UDP-N-acetylglucosamine 2-epimerase [Alkalibacillus sp. S2W]|uniref:UDP-N-acetylglucosamine 2-epimerase n=1 Tax=Alkalibacillus sp. S2W TaxID=3386553 RepID=UPI00398C89A6
MRLLSYKRICVVTATRAEYGLLKPLIQRLTDDPDVVLDLVVTGTHLSSEFGLTYQAIEEDGFQIDRKLDILLSSDKPSSISKTMGLALMSFADYFATNSYDYLVVLGDRYEILAVCQAAMHERIPIAHIHGGETTEGAVDEGIRHAITKLSHLHFTSTSTYRDRVIQLGESPERVFNLGALGVENSLNESLYSKKELEHALGVDLSKPYVLVTYHPVTLEGETSEHVKSLLEVCANRQDLLFIFTKANADAYGREINRLLEAYVENHHNAVLFDSLGLKRYLSAMQYATCVMGNSSSGIIEAPSFGIPTINIGDRQKGRLQADSVINCSPVPSAIHKALSYALEESYQAFAKQAINPYGHGKTSHAIVSYLKQTTVSLQKTFYDIR